MGQEKAVASRLPLVYGLVCAMAIIFALVIWGMEDSSESAIPWGLGLGVTIIAWAVFWHLVDGVSPARSVNQAGALTITAMLLLVASGYIGWALAVATFLVVVAVVAGAAAGHHYARDG